MPIYEYSCQRCGRKIEEVVLGGKEPNQCPCGGELRRVPSVCNHKTIWKGVDTRHFYDSEGHWLPDRDPLHGM